MSTRTDSEIAEGYTEGMPDGAQLPSLNPVPRSLLDLFLQELVDLGLTERQVEGHLVFIRLWQKFLQPQRLLDATPDELPAFANFLKQQELPAAEVRFATESVEHFYAFTLDRNPHWEEHVAWTVHLEKAPTVRGVPLWQAIGRKFLPHLRQADAGVLRWRDP
jgi:hypothetical protein